MDKKNEAKEFLLGCLVAFIVLPAIIGLIILVVNFVTDSTDRGKLGNAAHYCQERYEKTGDDYCRTSIDGIPITCIELTKSSSTSCSFDNPSGRNPKSDIFTHYYYE